MSDTNQFLQNLLNTYERAYINNKYANKMIVCAKNYLHTGKFL